MKRFEALLAALPAGFQPRPGWRLVCGGTALPAGVAQEARLRITLSAAHSAKDVEALASALRSST